MKNAMKTCSTCVSFLSVSLGGDCGQKLSCVTWVKLVEGVADGSGCFAHHRVKHVSMPVNWFVASFTEW